MLHVWFVGINLVCRFDVGCLGLFGCDSCLLTFCLFVITLWVILCFCLWLLVICFDDVIDLVFCGQLCYLVVVLVLVCFLRLLGWLGFGARLVFLLLCLGFACR